MTQGKCGDSLDLLGTAVQGSSSQLEHLLVQRPPQLYKDLPLKVEDVHRRLLRVLALPDAPMPWAATFPVLQSFKT